MTKLRLMPGDPAPWFHCRSTNNALFSFSTAAGRYIVLSFLGSARTPAALAAANFIGTSLRPAFDDERACFFGVSMDEEDEREEHFHQVLPGIRFFWDFDKKVSQLYGAINEKGEYSPFTLVLDPLLRVMASIPIENADAHNKALGEVVKNLPPIDRHAGTDLCAPVLVLPRVFEPEFCRHLIGEYEKRGGEDSGFMREKEGNTIGVLDHAYKRRRDFEFGEQPDYEGLRTDIRQRLVRRLVPEIQKSFSFTVTRIERYIVSCYAGAEKGFFKAHRDNTTKGTAHRRFACTLNLNAEEYDGGELRFPEFGSRTYRAPTGGAVVFSCSLLHEATPVTRGFRYAFLPFLYDDAAAKIRQENLKYLSGEVIDKTKDAGAI